MMNFLKKTLTAGSPLYLNQIRTTFILKRRWQPLLHKKNAKPKKLRGKHFVYDLVEDTLVVPRPNMEVVLTQYVEGVGNKGEIVSLKPNFAYNNILLPGLGIYKTDENIKKYSALQEKQTKEVHSSPYAARTVNMLQGLLLPIVMNKDEPWVVERWHIRASLRKLGYYCEDDCITLPKEEIRGPDLSKENKEFDITVTVNNLEKATVRCRIHHWSTNSGDRLPYVLEYWKIPAEPLFTETESIKS